MPEPVEIAGVRIGPGQPLALIAGPCVIESREHTLRLAVAVADICRDFDVPFIFKASFDKANRTSADSFRGPGIVDGLSVLAEVKRSLRLPVLSDIHEPSQADAAGKVLDCIQIPAFLCRQTDLIVAAARTGAAVNIKKGQFMAPEEMENAVAKVRAAGNRRVLLTERGTFFGYHQLVNDMTAVPRMKRFAPVVFDATHSCQLPGAAGTQTAGRPEFIPTLARAAVAVGCDALFLEVHDDPPRAKSDPATVLPLDRLGPLLQSCLAIRAAAQAT